MTQEFIVALLSANKAEQRKFHARQLPKSLFRECGPEIKWIYSYYDIHGHYPRLSELKHRFRDFPDDLKRKRLSAALNPLLDQHIIDKMIEATEMVNTAKEEGEPIGKILADFRSALSKVTDFNTEFRDLNGSDPDIAWREYRRRCELRKSGTGSGLFDTPTPWSVINDLIGPSEPGQYGCLVGRPSLGKSWLMLVLADHYYEMGEDVLFVSEEMPTEVLNSRRTAIRAGISYPRFRKADLLPKELAIYAAFRKRERSDKRMNKFIFTGVDELKDSGFGPIYGKIESHSPTAVFIDGAYKIKPEDAARNSSPVERLSIIANTCHHMALSRKLRVWNSLQFGRDVEDKTGDTKGSAKSVYGSDAFLQAADVLLMLSGDRHSSRRGLDIGKGRDGAVGSVNISFELSPPRFDQIGGNSDGNVEFKAI